MDEFKAKTYTSNKIIKKQNIDDLLNEVNKIDVNKIINTIDKFFNDYLTIEQPDPYAELKISEDFKDTIRLIRHICELNEEIEQYKKCEKEFEKDRELLNNVKGIINYVKN